LSIGNKRVLGQVAETFIDFEADDVDLASPPPADDDQERYTERSELGRGGLGEVVEVFDRDLRRVVALKRPRPDRLDGQGIAPLIREAQITAQLEHPNIPSIHALGLDEQGRPFFTMERLWGGSLAQALAGGGLPSRTLLQVFQQVAWAVAFAHSRGVLHRDLKPANIMVGDFGQVYLVDWGIAKLVGESDPAVTEPVTSTEDSNTTLGSFRGSLLYASPGQLRGEVVDQRSDIYSLGVLLYEMFAGAPPVTGDDPAAVRERILAGDFPPLGKRVRGRYELSAIVDKALALDPGDRYRTVLELLADVRALETGERIAALPEGPLSRLKRWYFGRSPRLARMRNADVDMLAWCTFLLGISAALWWTGKDDAWLMVFPIFGVLVGIRPMYAILRPSREEERAAAMPGEAVTLGTSSDTDREQTTRPR
jgi:serine/threonine protein kinase